mmetsp:Transcript_16994/g.31498  ORF Transcript_16994/g.31498 Transcript_16994/m.31498 type:complete len:566 (+) Transcript_16994:102-1799(+)
MPGRAVTPEARKGSKGPLSAKAQSELDDTNAKIQVQQFMDEWYYRILNSSLAKTCDQKAALGILLDIFVLLGINITDKEELLGLEEEALISHLVSLMNPQILEGFETIALQLQSVIHSSSRVRKACEDPEDDTMQEIFEGGGDSGVFQQILKSSVVESSKQVSRLIKVHNSWKNNTEARLARLFRAAEEAEHAMQQLVAIEAQLEDFGVGQKKKSKQMLMNMADGQDKTLMKSVFSSWNGFFLKNKAERLIRQGFETRIREAEDAYILYKAGQISNISGVLLRAAMEENSTLLAGVVKVWSDEINSSKLDEESKAKMKQVEAKLAQMAESQTANAKRVMTRMAAGNDKTILSMVIQGWVQFVYEYHRQKEMEDAVKRKEQEVQEHLKAKKEETKQVLNRLIGASDNGLKSLMMQNWIQYYTDEKKAKEMEAALLDVDVKFKALNLRQTQNARGVQTRINDQIAMNLQMRVFGNWLLETKTNRVTNWFNQKIESKRRQLQGVQDLFKRFAMQLEQNLGAEDDSSSRTFTGRTSGARGKLSRRGMPQKHVDGGSVSLPDIHNRPVVA